MPGESRPAKKKAVQASRRWSAQVAATSEALDLERGIFSHRDPRRIALSLKKSAMSMLNFFINRAGRKLPDSRRQVLEEAKDELRALFERPRHGTGKSKR